ncbi:hypothetical protein [Krasilnikovia sp. MM14-A1259]|uniref:hypothetical protein n=1 Tax=Krasilnikovia sp. MM14-A1259 TaxID=3373539 RepID=UPI00380865E3
MEHTISHAALLQFCDMPPEAVTTCWPGKARHPWITVKALPMAGTRQRTYTGRLGGGAHGLPFMIIRAYWLGVNAVLAYQALKRYFEHPDERPRLAHVGQPADH